MLRLPARLPDALVGVLPHLRRALRLGLDDRPEPPREALAAARVEQDGVEHRTEDVVLALVERAVPEPHRVGPGISRELVPRGLGQVAAPVDPVHDLERSVLVRLDVGDELHELVGLPVEIQEVQRLQRERRVAYPGVAVVPVALPARRLGQRCGERSDRGAGGHVRQALDRERRALDHGPPAMVDLPSAVEPGAPEALGGSQTRVGLIDAARSGKTLGPGERTVDLVALFERMPCPHAFALDPHPHVGPEPDRLTGTGRVGGVTIPVHERPLPGRAPVVEDHLAHQLDVDTAFQAQDGAHQHVIAVAVGRWPGVWGDRVLVLPRTHRQRVANDDHSGGRVPRRDEGVRAGS